MYLQDKPASKRLAYFLFVSDGSHGAYGERDNLAIVRGGGVIFMLIGILATLGYIGFFNLLAIAINTADYYK